MHSDSHVIVVFFLLCRRAEAFHNCHNCHVYTRAGGWGLPVPRDETVKEKSGQEWQNAQQHLCQVGLIRKFGAVISMLLSTDG